jgi:hypothetical protein
MKILIQMRQIDLWLRDEIGQNAVNENRSNISFIPQTISGLLSNFGY